MKHVKQGHNECLLAVLAMLSNRALWRIKLRYWWRYGRSWCNVLEAAKKVDDAFVKIHADTNRYAQSLGISLHIVGDRHAIVGILDYDKLTSADLYDRGALIIFQAIGDGHIVAFEDGMIYDPNEEGPMPFDMWYTKIKDKFWRITQLHREKD